MPEKKNSSRTPEPIRIKIRELDLNDVGPRTGAPHEDGFKLVISGKPGSGKSFLLLDWLNCKKHIFPVGTVVSGTEDSNKFFSKHFPKIAIHNKLEDKITQNVIHRQKLAIKYIPECPWAVYINDDCMEDPKQLRDPTFHNLFKNGRHYKLVYVLGMQCAMELMPGLRSCVDGIFIFREPNLRNRKTLYENYAGIIPTFKLFCEIMDAITNDWTALYIDNKTQSNDYLDCVYWYRAKETPSGFKFGCDDFWLFDETRRQPEEEELDSDAE